MQHVVPRHALDGDREKARYSFQGAVQSTKSTEGSMLGSSKRTSLFLLLAGVLFGILSLRPALAQTQAINGSIRGRVTDIGAASVPQGKVSKSCEMPPA